MKKYIIGAIALVILASAGLAHAASAPLTFRELVAKYAGEKIAAYFLGQEQANPSKPTLLGGAFTTGGSDFTDVRVVNLIASGDVTTTNFAMNGVFNAVGGLNVSATATLGYTPNQLNTPQVAFNGNSTTLCAVQNTSGVNRIISSLMLGVTGSTGSGAVTSFRGYVSAGRADNNTAASSTMLSTVELNIGATSLAVYGGPVPGSYYSSSTLAVFRTSNNLSTTTPVLWPIGWFANVTSTAITSSTGDCIIASNPL